MYSGGWADKPVFNLHNHARKASCHTHSKAYSQLDLTQGLPHQDVSSRLRLAKWRSMQLCGRVWLTSSQLGLVEPFSQDGLEFAGVLEAQLQIFKAADRGLAELWAVHCSESLAHIGLRVAWWLEWNTERNTERNTSSNQRVQRSSEARANNTNNPGTGVSLSCCCYPVWSSVFWSHWRTSPALVSAGSPWWGHLPGPARSSVGRPLSPLQCWGPRGPHQWRGRPRAVRRNRGLTRRNRYLNHGPETCTSKE